MISPAAALVAAALAAASPPAGGAGAAGDQGARRVALERLRSRGVSSALAEAVEERLCSEIARAARAEAVCPGDVAAAVAVARRAALLGECASDDCLRRVEVARAPERRVSGALAQGDKGLVLTLQVTTGAGPGPRIVEKLPADLEALMARLAGVADRLFPAR